MLNGREQAGVVPGHAPEECFGLPKTVTNTLFVLVDRQSSRDALQLSPAWLRK